MYDKDTVIANLTVGEFHEVVRDSLPAARVICNTPFVAGADGLASLLGITEGKARALIEAHLFDSAVIRWDEDPLVDLYAARRIWDSYQWAVKIMAGKA